MLKIQVPVSNCNQTQDTLANKEKGKEGWLLGTQNQTIFSLYQLTLLLPPFLLASIQRCAPAAKKENNDKSNSNPMEMQSTSHANNRKIQPKPLYI